MYVHACVVMVVDEMAMFAELIFISACYRLDPLLGCWTLWAAPLAQELP